VLGAYDGSYTGPNKWQFSTTWRYQKSDRHFRGSEEEKNRQAEGSEVVNTINLAELGIRYNVSEQTSVSVGIPYLMAERSSPIRNSSRAVVGRSITHASALSDITIMGRRLLWKPSEHPNGNVSFGLGVKLPTGRDNITDARTRMVNGQQVVTIETVDQSIQPGDGGFGAILDLQVLQRVLNNNGTAYLATSYLLNPDNTNGVHTFRGDSEEIMSVADQYLARVGLAYAAPSWKGLSLSLGGRLEGVPVHDLIGDSDGFRRPGYAVSVEPGMSYSKGAHSVSLTVPYALYRNRTRSVPDRLDGGHGDAAFADYIIMLGYWRRY
jgi:hypothetical protein